MPLLHMKTHCNYRYQRPKKPAAIILVGQPLLIRQHLFIMYIILRDGPAVRPPWLYTYTCVSILICNPCYAAIIMICYDCNYSYISVVWIHLRGPVVRSPGCVYMFSFVILQTSLCDSNRGVSISYLINHISVWCEYAFEAPLCGPPGCGYMFSLTLPH